MITRPVSPSTTRSSYAAEAAPIARRKLSIVASKCAIARFCPSRCGK